jgi:hypothetical protein
METPFMKELRARADSFLPQTRLFVDYYRIRRKFSYPLPVRDYKNLNTPIFPKAAMDESHYPWSVWLIWNLEERIFSLGWAGEWMKNKNYREKVSEDIEALAEWTKFRQLSHPDLLMGHCGRILSIAYFSWKWLSPVIRKKIEAGMRRLLQDALPLIAERFGPVKSREEILAAVSKDKNAKQYFHNIPLIGTIGAALAANVLKDPIQHELDDRLMQSFLAMFDYRKQGFTEAVSYDGYVLDLIADWITFLPSKLREPILSHPEMKRLLEETYMVGAPGDILNIAELSDVEPRQMTFQVSAIAKLANIQNSKEALWYLKQCRLDWMRSDGLAAARNLRFSKVNEPSSGALDAHYAVVLRTGWKSSDIAVAMSSTTSVMHHMHFDNGNVVIGTEGNWFLTEPGYQQYMETSEREFTLGPKAHNAPVINQKIQSSKSCKVWALSSKKDLSFAEVDLTSCYPSDMELTSVRRKIWLYGKEKTVVVRDQITGKNVRQLAYAWHGNPDAGWWVEDHCAVIELKGKKLWICSPQVKLSFSQINRLKGSRGHLTLSVELESPPTEVWWIFAFDKKPEVSLSGSKLKVNGLSIE